MTPRKKQPKKPAEPAPEFTDAFSTRVENTGPREVASVTHGRVRIVDVAYPTTRLVQIDTSERTSEMLADVSGSIVKLAPTIRSSERMAFDGASARAALVARGAVAVLVAPVVVPDEGKLSDVARAESPSAAIAAWFDDLPGVAPEDRDAARETALAYLASES